jgi:hypothetical protein
MRADSERLLHAMAEGEGFEPPVPFQAQRFSRPPVSTAHPSLRNRGITLFEAFHTESFRSKRHQPCIASRVASAKRDALFRGLTPSPMIYDSSSLRSSAPMRGHWSCVAACRGCARRGTGHKTIEIEPAKAESLRPQ